MWFLLVVRGRHLPQNVLAPDFALKLKTNCETQKTFVIPQFNFDSYFPAGASTSLPTLDLGAHSHHLAGSQATANAAAAAAAVNQSAARAAAAAAVAAVHPFLQLQKAASGEPYQQYSNP